MTRTKRRDSAENPIHALNREAKDKRISDLVRRMRMAGETETVDELARRTRSSEGYVRKYLDKHGMNDVIRTRKDFMP